MDRINADLPGTFDQHVFFGRALDAGYYHAVLVAGSLLQGLAVSMTSVSIQYWQLFLGSRHLQGAGRWAALLPDHLLGGDVFLEKSHGRHGVRCLGRCDWRHDVPGGYTAAPL